MQLGGLQLRRGGNQIRPPAQQVQGLAGRYGARGQRHPGGGFELPRDSARRLGQQRIQCQAGFGQVDLQFVALSLQRSALGGAGLDVEPGDFARLEQLAGDALQLGGQPNTFHQQPVLALQRP